MSTIFRKALERVHAARRRHHFATEVLQHVRGNFQNERIVSDNQYGTRHFELPADSVPAATQRDPKVVVPLALRSGGPAGFGSNRSGVTRSGTL